MSVIEHVASILLGYRVMRGTAEGPLFLATVPDEAVAPEWTTDLDAAVLFADRAGAATVQEIIVAREERCAAVVPT